MAHRRTPRYKVLLRESFETHRLEVIGPTLGYAYDYTEIADGYLFTIPM